MTQMIKVLMKERVLRKIAAVTGINVRTVIISLTLLNTVRQHGLITQLRAAISTVQYVATLRQALRLIQ